MIVGINIIVILDIIFGKFKGNIIFLKIVILFVFKLWVVFIKLLFIFDSVVYIGRIINGKKLYIIFKSMVKLVYKIVNGCILN